MSSKSRHRHCQPCTCPPFIPSVFVSDVRVLPYDLDRVVTWPVKSGGTCSAKAISFLKWDPVMHRFLSQRLRTYRELVLDGDVQNVREAVKMLAQLRREAAAEQLAKQTRQASRKVRRPGEGYERGLPFKKRLIRAEGDPCFYCGSPDPATVDHVMPTSRGGGHSRKNLVPACSPCNGQKRNRTPEEWKAARLAKGLSWPPVRPGSPACITCHDSGRAVIDGVDRHCDCRIGRTLRADWRQDQLFGELV